MQWEWLNRQEQEMLSPYLEALGLTEVVEYPISREALDSDLQRGSTLNWLLQKLDSQLEEIETNILGADVRVEGVRDLILEWQAKRTLIVGLFEELAEIRRGDQGI
jgi:hypothetical protein